MINLLSYNKLVGIRTIQSLTEEKEIDTVYVRYAYEDKDRMFDCTKPIDMINLERIIRERTPVVVGWRLHHHHREVVEETQTEDDEYLEDGWRNQALEEMYQQMLIETQSEERGDSQC